jgi:hypothetical protein
MAGRVYGRLSFVKTWPAVALLFVAFGLCQVGFGLRARYLGPCNEVPDGLWPNYTDEELHCRLAKFGPAGRNVYAVTECTLDVAFPLVCTALFAALLARVYSRKTARRLVFVPLLAMVADLCENACLAYLAWSFEDGHVAWSCWAAACTAVKYLLYMLSLALVGVGAVLTLVRCRRHRGLRAAALRPVPPPAGGPAGPGGAGT